MKTVSEKSVVNGMESSTKESDEAACLLAHEIIEKLTVIIGNCDLLSAKAQAGSECATRLGLIHDTAKEIAKELGDRQCRLLDAVRSSRGQKYYIV
jgi:hypothetical protein